MISSEVINLLTQYTNSRTQVEFFLKEERMFLELKLFGEKSEKQIKDDLLNDIPQYNSRPDIDFLVFYIFMNSDTYFNTVGFIDGFKTMFPDLENKLFIIFS